MSLTGLKSLIATGTRLWLDSIDPDLVENNARRGATGATSNPIIIADLIRTGRFDGLLADLLGRDKDDSAVAWNLTDRLVSQAQQVFEPVYERTGGDDGYVSFELDPLIDDISSKLTVEQRAEQYVELGRHWAKGHTNRMIKVPATPAGIEAIDDLVASDVPINITLIFSDRQYRAARDAVWRGAQRKKNPQTLKSVFSIFVSRIDVYTEKHAKALSPAAQGQVGLLNVQRIWRENQDWWQDKGFPLKQEIVFASTGTKKKEDAPDKYVEALAGSDIQTNPPATNDAVESLKKTYSRRVDQFPSDAIQQEIDRIVDFEHLEQTLMNEGLEKFATPQRQLVELITQHRAMLATAG